MPRTRMLILLPAMACSLLATNSASAAQRTYRVLSGTSTITLNNAWIDALRAGGGQIAASGGASIVVIQPKNAAPIYKLKIPVRSSSANILAYGTSSGTSLQFKGRGTVTISSANAGITLPFLRPSVVFSSPEISQGWNRLDAVVDIPENLSKGAGSFIRTGRVRIPSPRDGKVTVTAARLRFDYSGARSEWMPDSVQSTPMGSLSMSLRVKRR